MTFSAMGLRANGAYSNANRFGLTALWREARERRRAQRQEPAPAATPEIPPDIVHIDPSAEVEIPVAETVELPPLTVSLKPSDGAPSTDDLVAAALVADKPVAARDVEPGERWTFDHRTLAEVEAGDRARAPRRIPVIDRGEATVTDLVANQREAMLRRWLAGHKTREMTAALGTRPAPS